MPIMMEFCSSCGFLLPLDLVGKPFCGPCERDHRHQNSTKAKDWVCQCVLCGKAPPPRSSSQTPRYSDTPSFPRSDSEGEKKINKSPVTVGIKTESKNRRKKSKSRAGDAEKKKRFSKGGNEDEEEMDASQTPESPEETFKLWDALMEQEPNADWAAQPDWGGMCQSDWGLNDADDGGGWTEVKQKPAHNPLFGNHDFPVLERGLKESAVLQSVRDEWEREQNEMKCRLEIRDTPDIAQLVRGHRRKSKNSQSKDGRFHVGGVDISFIKDNTTACACLSIVRMPDLELVYQRMEMIQMAQPYIPGFLAFREVPPLSELFDTMKNQAPQYMPDVIMVDGNGILHPRGFGLASQLGVTLNIPTIGVAKTLMTAQGITDDGEHRKRKHTLSQAGEGFDLISDSGEILGKCVRNHDEAPNPVYVSVGHKITLESAVWLVLECSKYRIPEPIRRADLDSREYIRQGKTEPELTLKVI